ncbi:long-chain fatty acid--CoA ligase [Solimonas sp. K1W22B-7]|uniref:AMP-binding protein n=1 Tax=Solimonas sp. K1W22B-7 TaxID=2303331 RepID=UPI000E330D4C|nr:AMP-binding protein [Solimonas sp. K1W22B-7]AXQ30653.1 long-chain fatty acid--CoA ligase [Solimonas sp. K1W22B-7]
MNLVERLLDWERREPQRPWLFQPVDGVERAYTFGEVAAEVRRAAGAIRALGLPPGSRLGITGRNTAHWIIADLACAMAGHIAVGLYPRQGKATLGYVLDHAEVRHVFIGPSLMPGDAEEMVANLPAGVRSIALPYAGLPRSDLGWTEFLGDHAPLSDYTPPPADALAMLIYTSGTSGQPKGVMLSNANISFAIDNILKNTMAPLPREVLFSYLPLAHLMERVFGEAMGLAVGAELHFLEKPEALAETLARVVPTRFSGVPLVYTRVQAGILGKLPQHKLDRLLRIPLVNRWFRKTLRRKMGLQNVESLGCGAAAAPLPMIEWFEKLGLQINQGYGMTETCAYAAVELPELRRLGSVGKPLPDSGFRLAADGEIQFRHGGVMMGYFKDPAQTAAAFTEDGWLRTGDRGRVDADGFLYVTGRIKDEFKTGKGKYVVPVPIEGAMARNTDLEQLCLCGAGLNQPILLATLSPNGKTRVHAGLEAALRDDIAAVNATLAEHERIAQCLIVEGAWTPDNGLVTPTGKIRRPVIEAHYADLLACCVQHREQVVCWQKDLEAATA